jgi:molybdopterin synthase catalytic subunit
MISITSNPLYPEPIINNFYRADCGALVMFIGTVRNTDKNGRDVFFLEIETCGNDAEERLKDIASEVCQKWQIQHIAIQRRIGKLNVGEIALVVVIAAPRRKEAFEACQYIIDRIKMGGITRERDIYESDGG